MKKSSFFLLLLVFCSWAFAASASYISLNTTLTAKVEKKALKVLVRVVNKGDEPAHNVQAEIRAGGKKILAQKKPELGINQTYKVYETFALELKQAGQYPLVLIMHYTDANQYPFSALSCQTFSYKTGDLPSEIFGRLKSVAFWEKGKAKLTLKNIADSEIFVSTYLVVPREISVITGALDVALSPKSTKNLKFEVENFSALNGSSYQIFAISEYEREGIHQTTITPGALKIVVARTILGINYIYFVALFVGLVVLFVVFQFRKK